MARALRWLARNFRLPMKPSDFQEVAEPLKHPSALNSEGAWRFRGLGFRV